jgi:hypothetical protein
MVKYTVWHVPKHWPPIEGDVSEPQDLEKVNGVPASPSQVHQLILGALSADPSCAIATRLGVSVDQY